MVDIRYIIYSLRYEVRHWLLRSWEKSIMFIVWHLPRPIVYWSFIRIASLTEGNPADQTCLEALNNWERNERC